METGLEWKLRQLRLGTDILKWHAAKSTRHPVPQYDGVPLGSHALRKAFRDTGRLRGHGKGFFEQGVF